jgi:hypothetical protein
MQLHLHQLHLQIHVSRLRADPTLHARWPRIALHALVSPTSLEPLQTADQNVWATENVPITWHASISNAETHAQGRVESMQSVELSATLQTVLVLLEWLAIHSDIVLLHNVSINK